jgi:hypothetical protein
MEHIGIDVHKNESQIVAGASLREDYLGMMREAGFAGVEVLSEGRYEVGLHALPQHAPEREAFEAVVSVKVRGRKP